MWIYVFLYKYYIGLRNTGTCYSSIQNKKIFRQLAIIAYRTNNLEAATGDVPQKKVTLKNFAKFTGKHLCQNLFFIKLQAPGCNFNKKKLWHRNCPGNFLQFLRGLF